MELCWSLAGAVGLAGPVPLGPANTVRSLLATGRSLQQKLCARRRSSSYSGGPPGSILDEVVQLVHLQPLRPRLAQAAPGSPRPASHGDRAQQGCRLQALQ